MCNVIAFSQYTKPFYIVWHSKSLSEYLSGKQSILFVLRYPVLASFLLLSDGEELAFMANTCEKKSTKKLTSACSACLWTMNYVVLWSTTLWSPPSACVPNTSTLCSLPSAFVVSESWHTYHCQHAICHSLEQYCEILHRPQTISNSQSYQIA